MSPRGVKTYTDLSGEVAAERVEELVRRRLLQRADDRASFRVRERGSCGHRADGLVVPPRGPGGEGEVLHLVRDTTGSASLPLKADQPGGADNADVYMTDASGNYLAGVTCYRGVSVCT